MNLPPNKPFTKAVVKHGVTGWQVILYYRTTIGWTAYHLARFASRKHITAYLDRLKFDVIDDVVTV